MKLKGHNKFGWSGYGPGATFKTEDADEIEMTGVVSQEERDVLAYKDAIDVDAIETPTKDATGDTTDEGEDEEDDQRRADKIPSDDLVARRAALGETRRRIEALKPRRLSARAWSLGSGRPRTSPPIMIFVCLARPARRS